MKWYFWVLLVCVAIFTVDLALAYYAEWRKRRHRAREMQKYGLSPFKPASRNWWMS